MYILHVIFPARSLIFLNPFGWNERKIDKKLVWENWKPLRVESSWVTVIVTLHLQDAHPLYHVGNISSHFITLHYPDLV